MHDKNIILLVPWPDVIIDSPGFDFYQQIADSSLKITYTPSQQRTQDFVKGGRS